MANDESIRDAFIELESALNCLDGYVELLDHPDDDGGGPEFFRMGRDNGQGRDRQRASFATLLRHLVDRTRDAAEIAQRVARSGNLVEGS